MSPSPQPLQSNDIRAHFGLHTTPFTRELRIQQRWSHPIYDDALSGIHRAVDARMSAAIIAPAGAGKTVLLRRLVDLLPEARYRTHYVKVTDLSKRDMCREIAKAVGCKSAGYYGALVANIQERAEILMDQESLRPVLIIDEAHDIRPTVLSTLRVITNFDMDSRLVLSVVLAGQMPLRRLLRNAQFEAVSRRIAHFASLRLLTRGESRLYIEHRLHIAGGTREIFADESYDALYEVAQGNLRATDRIALKSIEEATAAGATVVGADHVASARQKVWP